MSELLQKQFKFSKMISELILWMYEQGYTVQKGDAWRSTDKLYVPGGIEGFEDDEKYSYQELLFYNKKTKVLNSPHTNRLAEDLLIWKDGKQLVSSEYRPIGEKWEAMGGRWGGRFGVAKEEYNVKIGWDANHFELP
jgi:hypothetical protein